jgi:hypothetical protein
MAAKTPMSLVKEKFGEKSKLVDALEKLTGDALWVSRTNKDKGLAHVSNAKLLRLHATFSEVKEKFGTREKLIDAILEVEKRTKDAGYREKLTEWPVPRLFDAYKSATKRTNTGGNKGAHSAAPKKTEAPKVAAKKAVKTAKTIASAKAKAKAAKKKAK